MEVKNILLSMIHPSAMNPRKTFDTKSIEELAQNIAQQGLLQPITVRIVEYHDYLDEDLGEVVSIPKYEIVCGERRYRACSHNKMETIPCIVVEMDDKQAFDAMITENLQRKDVDPIEEAFAFDLLIQNGSTAEDVALRFGKSVRFVQDRMRLNGLNDDIKKMVTDGNMPLTGAFIVSKLDADIQKELVKWAKDQYELDGEWSVPVAAIDAWISRRFMALERAMWIDDEKVGNQWTDKFKMCANCEHNSSNHGCLFYEMKNENPECTNPTCFSKKEVEYVLYRLSNLDMVKEGEEITHGKTVVIDTEGYQRNGCEKVFDAIKAQGYKIVKQDVFDHKCWYSGDDERVEQMLKDQVIYPCIEVWGYGTVCFRKVFYYVKRNSEVKKTKTQLKSELVQQYRRNKEIAIENKAKALRGLAKQNKFSNRKGSLLDEEQLVLDSFVLYGCSEEYLKSQGLSKYNIKRTTFKDYITNNQEKRNDWYREFIREHLTSANVEYNAMFQLCQDIYFRAAYPDDFKKLGDKLAKSLDKKQSKIAAQLKEMGYDTDGMLLKEA